MIRVNSLRARMTIAVTVAFAVWVLLVCLGFMVYAGHSAMQQVDRVLTSTTSTMRHDLREMSRPEAGELDTTAGLDRTPAALTDLIDEHREDLMVNHVAAFLVDAHGKVIQQSQARIPSWPLTQDNKWRIRTISAGSSTLVLGYHWGQIENELHERALTLLAFSLCMVLAAAGGAWVLVGRTLSPIGRLAQQATTSSAETLGIQLTAPSQDSEIVGLVTTLNDLLARISDTAASKGRFYAAASHELRTPVQALSGHLEVALSRLRTADEYRATLKEAHTQTRRLADLVRDLLLLNQLDTATTPNMREMVSIAEICDRAIRHYQPLITQHTLRLHTELEQEGEVLAPPAHAEMLVRNLIENAVKYAAPGGEVRIALSESKSQITVAIFNSCAPIENWHAETLFEPFFRLDASRNAETGGNGLGLAICKAIALVNGWQITLEHGNSGVMATLYLPRHAALA